MLWSSSRWSALVVALWLGAAGSARAQDSGSPPPADAPTPAVPANIAEAQERIAHAEALFEQRDYETALAEFQRAYELIGDNPARYILYFNIAQCHRNAFRYDRALDYLQRYLREAGPDAEDRPMVERTLRSLEQMLGTIVVQTNVPGAVWVENRRVGAAPGEILLPGREYDVELRARGYVTGHRRVRLAPRTRETMTFQLDRLAREYTGLSPVFFWSATGAAVVTLGIGAALGLSTLSFHDELETCLTDPRCEWDVADRRASLDRRALVTDVFFITGGVLAAGAVVLAILTRWTSPPEEPRQRARARLTLSPSTLGLEGSF